MTGTVTVASMPALTETAVDDVLDQHPVRERSTDARTIDVGATVAWFRHGAADPTTWIDRVGRGEQAAGQMVRATLTPDGPGTIRIRWAGRVVHGPGGPSGIDVDTWGPGAGWLAEQVPAMTGAFDTGAPELERAPDAVVARAARDRRCVRIGRTGDLYHSLLPTIVEQRITSGEAKRQWRRLCIELGEPAPGPFTRLMLPPAPDVLARRPSWWFHPRGVERKRAEPLIEVARHASKLRRWSDLSPAEAAAKLRLLRGVGVWTIGSVLGPAMGDPDAVPVGDYHVKNWVAWALAGEPRATDERMLELLAPYAGQRGRVVRLIKTAGPGAPKYGPRQRVLPMHEW